MITTSDIADIIYVACGQFDIPVYRKGYIPDGVVDSERIVVIPKEQTPQTYWKKCFVEVNICVPDLNNGVADLDRLQDLERMAQLLLDDKVGQRDSTSFRYGIESLNGINRDENMKCHYVNVRLLFEVLNC